MLIWLQRVLFKVTVDSIDRIKWKTTLKSYLRKTKNVDVHLGLIRCSDIKYIIKHDQNLKSWLSRH